MSLYPVTGTVMIDGSPAPAGVAVFFSPAEGRLASGTTDESGEFVITVGEDKGATPGPNRIGVMGRVVEGTALNEDGDLDADLPGNTVTWVVAQKFSDYNNSGIPDIDVVQGMDPVTIEVSAK